MSARRVAVALPVGWAAGAATALLLRPAPWWGPVVVLAVGFTATWLVLHVRRNPRGCSVVAGNAKSPRKRRRA